MGISYNTNSVLAIQAVTEHSAATVSSAMQLTDSLGQVLGTGMGGIILTIVRWAHGRARFSAVGTKLCENVNDRLQRHRLMTPGLRPPARRARGSRAVRCDFAEDTRGISSARTRGAFRELRSADPTPK
jgi:hypothetical protein